VGWFKSSYSAANDQCVECCITPADGVRVRDSKRREGPVLAFPFDEWRAFVAGAEAGEFDAQST